MLIPIGRDVFWRFIALQKTSTRPVALSSHRTPTQQRFAIPLIRKGKSRSCTTDISSIEKRRQSHQCGYLPLEKTEADLKTIDTYKPYFHALDSHRPSAEKTGEYWSSKNHFNSGPIIALTIDQPSPIPTYLASIKPVQAGPGLSAIGIPTIAKDA